MIRLACCLSDRVSLRDRLAEAAATASLLSSTATYASCVPFDPSKLRVERFHVQLAYHAAFQYWTGKALLAERWAHGPYFGGYVEGPGDQLTLVPGPEPDQPQPALLQAVAGIRLAAFNAEPASEPAQVSALADEWLSDVYKVLDPKRTVTVRSAVFGLYPIRDPDRATAKLRDRFYVESELKRVIPERYSDYHNALDVAVWEGKTLFSSVIGVMGPPHKGMFFSQRIPERDDAWWVGFNMSLAETDDDGISNPVQRVKSMSDRLQSDLQYAARTVLPEVTA